MIFLYILEVNCFNRKKLCIGERLSLFEGWPLAVSMRVDLVKQCLQDSALKNNKQQKTLNI